MIQPLLLPFLFLALSETVKAAPPVIYGEDNRIDTVESKNAFHMKLAASTAAHVLRSDIQIVNGKATFSDRVLNDFMTEAYGMHLCDDERYKNQVIFSNFSGFLVAPDIIVTAGHCFQRNECTTYDWVFNYKIAKAGDLEVTVDENDVYHCQEVVKQQLGGGKDFAVIRLDRAVKGIAPLKVAAKSPSLDTPLVMIGHPSGLPQKIADGATVKEILEFGFKANVDAFGGNSGSAVFNEKTGEVVGILVNGANDYSLDSRSRCIRAAKLSQEDAKEGISGVEQFAPFLK